MDWWAWVLVIVVLGLVAVGWWRSRTAAPRRFLTTTMVANRDRKSSRSW